MNKNSQSMVAGMLLTIISLIYLPIFSIIVKSDSNALKTKVISVVILLVLIIGAISCFIYSYFKTKKLSNNNSENKEIQDKKSPLLSTIIGLAVITILLVIGLVVFFMAIS